MLNFPSGWGRMPSCGGLLTRALFAFSDAPSHCRPPQIPLSTLANRLPRIARPAPTQRRRLATFQFLVNREEVLNFQTDVREDSVHGVDLVITGIPARDRQNLLIALVLVNHIENPN